MYLRRAVAQGGSLSEATTTTAAAARHGAAQFAYLLAEIRTRRV